MIDGKSHAHNVIKIRLFSAIVLVCLVGATDLTTDCTSSPHGTQAQTDYGC